MRAPVGRSRIASKTEKTEERIFQNNFGCIYRLIGLVGRLFANGPGDLGSISGHIIPKT